MGKYHFDFGFWNLNIAVLNQGEKQFQLLAKSFHVSEEEQSEVEDMAKDDVADAIARATLKCANPFRNTSSFLLSNLINKYRLENLIGYICEKQGKDERDFDCDAYNDGAYVKVLYKGEPIG